MQIEPMHQHFRSFEAVNIPGDIEFVLEMRSFDGKNLFVPVLVPRSGVMWENMFFTVGYDAQFKLMDFPDILRPQN